MPEQISYDEEAKIIRVVSSGDITLKEWMNSLSTIDEIGRRENCRRVLVDISQQTSIPRTVELYAFGKELPTQFKYALVDITNLSENHVFLKNVGVNRGKTIAFFRDEHDAIAWLFDTPGR